MSLSIDNLIKLINNYTNFLFYIGQTDNPKRRLKEHFNNKNILILIPLYKDTKTIIDTYEQQLIKHFSSNKNNMNLLINNIPKNILTNDIINNDLKNQFIYIAFKDYDVLNILINELKNNALIIYKTNKNNIINYQQFISLNNKDFQNINEKIKEKKEFKQKEFTEEEYNNIYNYCINKIDVYLNQKVGKFKYFHIGKCKNYNEKKNKLLVKGISSNNIKQIKKCQINDKLINKLKFDLCENYKNKTNIILDNKNNIFSNLFKNIVNNHIIYIYFY